MPTIWYLVYVTPPDPSEDAARPLHVADAVARCAELKARGLDNTITEATPPNRRISEQVLKQRASDELA